MKQAWSKEEIVTIASDITNEAIDENIEANPTLEGDEETLSSIGIKGTNYVVGGGSEVHLYEHFITLKNANIAAEKAYLTVFTDSLTPLTQATFAALWVARYGDNGRLTMHPACSTHESNNLVEICAGIYKDVGNNNFFKNVYRDGNLTAINVNALESDTITQIF